MDNTKPEATEGSYQNASTNPVNPSGIIEKIKLVLTKPRNCWATITTENQDIPTVYKSFVIPLAVIGAIAGYIGTAIMGVTASLVLTIGTLAMQLVFFYIGAVVVEWLAPKFNGQASRDQAFRYVAYSWTPLLVAGVFGFIPGLGALLSLVGLIYAIYLFCLGAPRMANVASDKLVPFIISYFVIMIVIGIVVGAAFAMLGLGGGFIAATA